MKTLLFAVMLSAVGCAGHRVIRVEVTSVNGKPPNSRTLARLVESINVWETTPEGRAKLGSDAGKQFNR